MIRFVPQCEVLEARLALDAAHPIPLKAGIVGPALAYERPVNVDGGGPACVWDQVGVTGMVDQTHDAVTIKLHVTGDNPAGQATVYLSSTAIPELNTHGVVDSNDNWAFTTSCRDGENGEIYAYCITLLGVQSPTISDYLSVT